MTKVKEKNIILKNFGTLHILKGRQGPILTPFKAKVIDIMHMLNVKYEVYEILDNGKELKLDFSNYTKDNNVKEVVNPINNPPANPIPKVNADTVPIDVEDGQTVGGSGKSQNNVNNNSNKNNKNK